MINAKRFGFSLDLVNLDYQEPNRNRYESKYFWDELFTLIPAAGFSAIEIPYQPKWDFGGRSGIPLTKYAVETKYKTVADFAAFLKVGGIDRISGITFNPSLFFGDNLDMYFGAFGHFADEAIQFAREAGAGVLTITPTPCYGLVDFYYGKAEDFVGWKNQFIDRTVELLGSLAQKAADQGVVLSVKNEFWSLARETGFDDFTSKLDAAIRFDIDTAHLAIQGADPTQAIKKLAGRIGSVHLTDTSYADPNGAWRLVNPEFPAAKATQVFRDIGQGSLDIAAAVNALDAIGYDGPVICSCRQTRDVSRALLRTRHQIEKICKG